MSATSIDPDAEWLEADGSGGFASGTVGGERTRRYHALLLTATTPPTGRLVLVNGFEAWIAGCTATVPLTTQRYRPDVRFPEERVHLEAFSNQYWPTWTFTLPDFTGIVHEVVVHPDACETLLRWRRTSGTGACRLRVRLLLSGRDYHALHRENAAFRFDARSSDGNVCWRPYPGVPAITALTNGTYDHAPEWYRNFLYSAERDRGLDDSEDLASPGVFTFQLAGEDAATIVLRAGDSLAGRAASYGEVLAQSERTRRAAASSTLARSARSYRVARDQGRTLIAGFPWFTDWGRDTFIAVRGLVLALGDLATADRILTAWASTVSQGMLPNRFPDHGEAAEYNSVDASLWYIVAVHDFLAGCEAAGRAVNDRTTARLRGACEAVLHGYTAGTRFGIKADPDGLLRAGVSGLQLLDGRQDR